MATEAQRMEVGRVTAAQMLVLEIHDLETMKEILIDLRIES